jgi:NADH:ubiquinone oxidoreductase subunit C
MTREALQEILTGLNPDTPLEESGPWPCVRSTPGGWPALARQLREHASLQCDYLFCLTCIDWKTQLEMVYHLSSTADRSVNMVVKVKLDTDRPEIETVSGIWRTAEFHEREVYEMFGVQFTGHPDLRLLILPDGWEGKNPLRKDFEDPVNMIRL